MTTTPSNFSRLQELLPELFQSNQLTGDSYLRCQLTSEINVLLSMESVQESLLVSEEQITLIPNMHSSVVGLMSSRDRVFALIDLPQFLGLTTNIADSRRVYHTVVTRVSKSSSSEQELLFGFAFNRVQGITRVDYKQTQSQAQDIPSSLMPYICGCLVDREQQLPVLDMANIVKQVIEM